MPNGDNDLCGPGDAERARVIVFRHSNAKLGALDDKVAELSSNCPVWCADDVVSVEAVPTAYCELECTESCECVLEVLPLGDDISHAQNFCSTTDTKLHSNKLS